MTKQHLYLVDGSGYIFRAYFSLPKLTDPQGTPVGAVHGFTAMLWKLIEELNAAEAPTHLAVILDAGAKTFRNDLYPAYKANRPPAPEDLVPQFPLIRDATRAFSLPCIEVLGFEADDLIASYARAATERGWDVTIVSSDKDLMQLVGDRVSMLDTMKNLKIGPDQVFEKFGVTPDKVVDVQALCGDSVDNVPGAPGIGVKTAALLINEYVDLDSVLARASEVDGASGRRLLALVQPLQGLLRLGLAAGVTQQMEAAHGDGPEVVQRHHLLEGRRLLAHQGGGLVLAESPGERADP